MSADVLDQLQELGAHLDRDAPRVDIDEVFARLQATGVRSEEPVRQHGPGTRLDEPTRVAATRRGWRPRWRAAAAAVVLAVGLLGLVVATNRPASDGPATSATTPDPPPPSNAAPTPMPATEPDDARPPTNTIPLSQLVNIDRLATSRWVVAPAPPTGSEMILARRDIAEPDEIRVVGYGPTSGEVPELSLIIEIDPPPSPASGETVTIAGVEWSINVSEPGSWNVSRQIGDTYVEVQGFGEIDDDLVESLIVVDENDLPLDPLGRQADAHVVARTDFENATYTYEVQESGRYRCAWFTSTGDGGAKRCAPVPSDAVVVIDGTQSIPDRPDRVVAAAWGSATDDIATVEVEFLDGTVVTVEPTDLSDTFDKRFWIAAAITTDAVMADPAVAAVRAYASDGSLVATEVPTPVG